MVVYRELSSLCNDLGYSARALYAASNTIYKHYHRVDIPKADGGKRTLNVPDLYLKSIQKSIVRNLLIYEEISPYATAYYTGGSTRKNAGPHIGATVILKMDIKKFFDHITFPMIKKKVFTADKYSEANRVLLSVLCVHNECTPQGAPTSPYVSNIIMRDFDNRVGAWCEDKGIKYTRYCDDMTFSGNFDPKEVKAYVTREIRREGFFVNNKKTIVVKDGRRKEITGIVVNEKISVPNAYKRRLRQEIYYCRKFGVDSHIAAKGVEEGPEKYLRKLLGRANYILSVERDNNEIKEYKEWIVNQMKVQNCSEC